MSSNSWRLAPRRLVPASCLLLSCLLLSSCGWLLPAPQLRGNKVDPQTLQELVPGSSTKADVTAVLGSPTAHATFDDNTWLYISETTRPRIGRTTGELTQHVVAVKFNQNGVFTGYKDYDKADSLPVHVIARTTPSPGTSASFLQELLGNVGRYNPGAGMSNNATAPAGGAPSPIQ